MKTNKANTARCPRGLLVRTLTNTQGVALIITLFVVALVTVLVLEYYFDASVEIDLAANFANDVQAYHLALSGVSFVQAMLQRDDSKVDGPTDLWYRLNLLPTCLPPQQLLTLAGDAAAGPLGLENFEKALTDGAPEEGCVELRVIDEQSKLPINALAAAASEQTQNSDQESEETEETEESEEQSPNQRRGRQSTPNQNPAPQQNQQNPGADEQTREAWQQVFQNFFTSFQVEPDRLEFLKDWVNPVGNDGKTEDAYYEGLEHPYKATHGPMRSLGELRLVRGFDAETLAKFFPGLAPERLSDLDLGDNNYLTVYGTKVNLNTALPEVLRALLTGLQGTSGSADAVVTEIEAQRQEKPIENLNEISGFDSSRLGEVADVKSTYFRIISTGRIGVIRKRVIAVLKRGAAGAENPNGQQSTAQFEYLKVE
jgi:type II secretory pathway component PulK